jgi:hypothetical protein
VSESSEPEPTGEPGPSEESAKEPGNGNGQHTRRFEDGWNQLLDPHKTRDQRFVLPGYDGLPFRGNAVPFLKEDDPSHRQPQVAYEPHVWILDLSNKEDLDDYRAVFQLVTNGSAIISAEDRQYDPVAKNWRIFLRWALVFTHMPKDFVSQA